MPNPEKTGIAQAARLTNGIVIISTCVYSGRAQGQLPGRKRKNQHA